MPQVPGGSFLFLRKFLKHGTRVASVRESSRALATEVCRFVTPDKPQVILELGAGTGAVTCIAERKLHPDSRLVAVELDADFAAVLAQRCPRAEVVCGDVAELDKRLPELGIERFDLVLSGLPTPSLPKAVNRAVFETIERVAADACFSQLTLMPWYFWKLYRGLYEQVDFNLVLASLPPGGVYHGRRLRADWRDHVPGK